MTTTLPGGITIVHVLHASGVAAIPDASGPRALLEAGLAEALGSRDLPVRVVAIDLPPDAAAGEVGRAFAVADRVARAVREATARGELAVVLSGSCHVGLGAVSGIPGDRRGVLWFDAHGDINTPETTGSGLLDGTVLASITGRCWRRMNEGVSGFSPVADEHVLLIGVRELDEGEAALLRDSGIGQVPAEHARADAPEAFRRLGAEVGGVYVHIDLDVLDRSVGKANAYALDGGLSADELGALVGLAAQECPVRALGIASYDPATDTDGGVRRATLDLARALADTLASGERADLPAATRSH
jgi:arginase